MNDTKQMGDDEAAAAIAGMIETYGGTADPSARVYRVYVSSQIEADGCFFSVTEYQLLGTIPGGILVVRYCPIGEPSGPVRTINAKDIGVCMTKVEAYVWVAEELLRRREAVTSKIEEVRAVLRGLTAIPGESTPVTKEA
jgi:hypothetical protein